MGNNKDFTDHLSDFGRGLISFFTTAYNFGDFLGRISGLRDWQHGSVVLKNYHQQEAIEEAKLFWKGISGIDSVYKAKMVFDVVKKDVENRPLYYLGSFGIGGFMSSMIKTGSKITDITTKGMLTTTMISTKAINTIHEFYPSFKTIQNNICSLYSNNKNYTNLFNQDMIMCSFLQNDKQETTSQPQNLQQELQRLYHHIWELNTEFNAYKPVHIISFTNPKASYIQKIAPNDIESLSPHSPIHLLKALFFCEDYILLDENKNPLINETNIRDFYNYKSDFYIIFILQKDTLTQNYLNERKALYAAIMQIKKEQQMKEIQDLQAEQEKLNQVLQGLDSKQKEAKLKDLQIEHNRQLKEQERQKQILLQNHTNSSSLMLSNNDEHIKVVFFKSYVANNITPNISFSNLIIKNGDKVTIFAKDGTSLNAKENEKILGLVSDSTPAQIYFGSLKIEGGDEDTHNAGWFYGKSGETYSIDSMGNINIYYNNMCMKLNNCYHEAYDM